MKVNYISAFVCWLKYGKNCAIWLAEWQSVHSSDCTYRTDALTNSKHRFYIVHFHFILTYFCRYTIKILLTESKAGFPMTHFTCRRRNCRPRESSYIVCCSVWQFHWSGAKISGSTCLTNFRRRKFRWWQAKCVSGNPFFGPYRKYLFWRSRHMDRTQFGPYALNTRRNTYFHRIRESGINVLSSQVLECFKIWSTASKVIGNDGVGGGGIL